ncbi:MAG: metal-dependent phosphohydrolase [Candidatus Berkelbacteria bacterium Licking1014_85]|uniref:5'-deoxynucleotidase n=1 Tax=Candidatus Berkelbacteria bacterium Licking1014_85 TaxID=2017148 RepID=A0A554LKF9_9BACT|nr:MAG: metal-dependent phosphohydrolase [Candidatus Berkelbacteria bacterium Licking1014_85]
MKKQMSENKKIMYLIQQAGTLMMTNRSHIRNLGNVAFDTLASHSFHVGIIAYCIVRMEKLSHIDGMQAITMGIFHDLAEARTGDNDFVTKNYTVMDEYKAIKDQFSGIDFGKDLMREIDEYEKRTSKVSKCVKDADCIAQMFMEWSLSWQGNKLAEKWFKGDLIHRVPYLKTKSAKKIIELIKKSDPQEWWWNELVNKKGPNLKHLNG